MKRRAQIFTLDMVLGAALFLVALITIVYLWDMTLNSIQTSEDNYEMNALASTAVDQLVRIPGNPYNWTKNNVQVYGLVDARQLFGRVEYQDRVIDPDKMLQLAWMMKNNYQDTRDSLIGVGKYSMYIEFSCLDENQSDCFNGLQLNTVNYDVHCNNDFTFSVDNINHVTDSNTWIEAEIAFGNNVTAVCYKGGCSNNQVSQVIGERSNISKTTVGLNAVWARVYDDAESFNVTVNQVRTQILSTHNQTLKWFFIGIFNLSDQTDLRVGSNMKLFDALLITSNMGYNPEVRNPPYGNPRVDTTCIVGNYSGGREQIVKSERTATFSRFVGGRKTSTNETVRVKVVLWTGSPQSGQATTSTLPQQDLQCYTAVPSLGNICSEFKGVEWIDDIQTGDLQCGRNDSVYWYGTHNSDPNYWGFFLNSSNQQLIYLDSCKTYNSDTQNTSYRMSCTLHMPMIELSNGTYGLTVTAEDGPPEQYNGGYCYPQEPGVDAKKTIEVNVRGCKEFRDLECLGPVSELQSAILGSNYTIHSMSLQIPPDSQCGFNINATIRWNGYHGDHIEDNYTYFGFFLDNTGNNIGSCKSENKSDMDFTSYNMRCSLLMPSAIGVHRIIAVANDKYGYCKSLTNIHAIDWIICVDNMP
jgi:hypothetical protein